MNISVLSTGGTIGSTETNGVIAPESEKTLTLFRMYREKYGGTADFSVCRVCGILSENADDHFYETLFSALHGISEEETDGVIVLHGTDTLSYTAALCAMACRDMRVPVGFVSSAFVLSDPRQNGLRNFYAAVRYIECGGAGFFVPYQNKNGETQIHLATRITEADAFLADFHSAKDLPLAVLEGTEIRFSCSSDLPSQELLRAVRTPLFSKKIGFHKSVLPLKMYPNLDFSAIDPNPETCAAVLVVGYHSGTASNLLSAFSQRMREKQIPVYLAPVSRADSQYASTRALLEAGVNPLFSMTAESALAKLKLAYNQTEIPPEKLLREVFYFEEVPMI